MTLSFSSSGKKIDLLVAIADQDIIELLLMAGVSPSVIGAFGGLSALVGILAMFMTASLVRELDILKVPSPFPASSDRSRIGQESRRGLTLVVDLWLQAGVAGLIAQSTLLGAVVVVYLTGAVSMRGALFGFLGLIVASRLGHMAYSAIGLQVVQMGNPAGKAKLIGTTEIAVASLAELAMAAAMFLSPDESKISELVKSLSEKKIGVVAHFYMDPEVQGILTASKRHWPHIHISDSLVMADSAVKMAEAGCEYITVLGVDFMSENVRAILDQSGFNKAPLWRGVAPAMDVALAIQRHDEGVGMAGARRRHDEGAVGPWRGCGEGKIQRTAGSRG
ncbi:hypothetical protein GUJ93_ZPchr0009g2093 [Zizania palustris]|uniref:Solute carrier family 40 member n=1 Tax=Zizania palustris TaxID=103762 RepID=A0A8J5VID2_ZIZPA|nr:hypothetical protein GUJ93_ZPchr0009g2093 [Zizania palustris]